MSGTRTLDADVVVVGLGSMGAMALWRLSRRPGVRILGVDQFGIGHAHGAAAGESRLFRTAYHEGSGYVPMLLRARELWCELGAEARQRLLLEVGTLSIGRAGDPSMSSVLESVHEHSLPHEVVSGTELSERWPQHAVGPDHLGVLDLLGGALRPEAAVVAAVDQAVRRGATVATGEEVVAVTPQGDGTVVVVTDRRELRATAVVVSAGAWSARLDPAVAARTQVWPLLLTWFLPTDPRAFDADKFPTFIRDEPGTHLFGAPSLDGYTVKVSPARILHPVSSVSELPTTVDPDVLSEVGRNARRFFPALHPEPVRYSVHPDAFTPDKVPIVERNSEGNVITLAGFSGHGFKFAPVVGEMAAELALDGSSRYWSPAFGLRAHADLTVGN